MTPTAWILVTILSIVMAFCAYKFITALLPGKEPPQLDAPKSELERLKEQYALGEITLERLEQDTTYELYIKEHEPGTPVRLNGAGSYMIIEETPKPETMAERVKRLRGESAPRNSGGPYAENDNAILRRVKQYWEENAPHE